MRPGSENARAPLTRFHSVAVGPEHRLSYLSLAKRMLRSLCLILVVAGGGGRASWGQPADADENPTGLLVTRYTSRDGLPLDHANDLVLGADGFLWIATFDGLARFDGLYFIVFTPENTPGLPTSRLETLMRDAEGALWIRAEDGTVVRFQGGRARAFVPGRDLPPGGGRPVMTGGRVWVVTDDGLFRYEHGQSGEALVRYRPGLVRGPVVAVHQDRAGAVWALTQRRLIRVDPGGQARAWDARHLPAVASEVAPSASQGAGCFSEGRNGQLWVLTQGGVARFEGGRLAQTIPLAAGVGLPRYLWTSSYGVQVFGLQGQWWQVYGGRFQPTHPGTPGEPSLKITRARAHAVSPDGAVWQYDQGWVLRDGAPVYRVRDRSLNWVALVADSFGAVWVTDGGLVRLAPPHVTSIGEAEGFPGRNVYPTLQLRDGAVLAGAWEGIPHAGLVRLTPTGAASQIPIDASTGERERLVTTLYEDRRGGVWVGTYGWLGRLAARGARVEAAGLAVDPAYSRQVGAITEDAAGRLWLGNAIGLAAQRQPGPPGSATREAWTTLALAHPTRALVPTPGGAVLVGTLGGGLGIARLDGSAIHAAFLTNADGLSSNYVRDAFRDERGVVWAAMQDRGLCRVAPDRRAPASDPWRGAAVRCATRDDGLFDNSLHRVIPDGQGRLWLSSNRGLFWVDRAAMDGFAAAPPGTIEVPSVAYDERDGMTVSEANGGYQPAGFRARDGRLWFPTQAGLAVVDPAESLRLPVPRAVVTGVTVNGGVLGLPDGDVRMAAGVRDLDLQFVAPTLARPQEVRYRYRLVGYDDAWREVGQQTRASYTNLPPGEYRFEVQAGRPGRWARQATTLAVVRKAHVWERPGFALVLLVLLAGGAAWAVARVGQRRLEQAKRRAQRLEAAVDERTREVAEQNERLRLQAQMLAAQAEKLQDASEARGRFLANVSHELRTPLTLTFGPLRDLLHGHYAVEQAALPALRRAERHGERLLSLIDQLLDLSRLDAGRLDVHRQRLDLAAFVRVRVAAFASLADDSGVALTLDVDDAVPIAVDPEKMETVVLNLLSNALKFTPAGGTVAVRVRPTADGAAFEVTDTGVGIPEDALPHLFDRFYQGEASKARGDGAGIGLSLVRELVRLHGGSVTVTSQEGEGTTFTVTVPDGPVSAVPPLETVPRGTDGPDLRGDGEATPEPQPTVSLPGSAGDRPLLLVVEDNDDLRDYLRSHLASAFRVEEAPDGAEGLRRARTLVPDAILSDVMMPELDGFALLAALKADPRTADVPVVLLTARADAASRLAGLQTGADDYLAKPFQPEEVVARLRGLVQTRRALRERYAQIDARPDEDASEESTNAAFLRQIQEAVEARIGDVTFRSGDMAEAAGLSERQLRRRLLALTGETPADMLVRLRLDRAAALFIGGDVTLAQVAERVGYGTADSLRVAFKKRFGVTPSAYAKGGAGV